MSSDALFILIFLAAGILGVMFYHAEYQSVKKHYKDMTFVDFVFTRDKLVITPDRR